MRFPLFNQDAGATGGGNADQGQQQQQTSNTDGQQQQQTNIDTGDQSQQQQQAETPEFTRTQVSKMVSDRVNELSKKYEGHDLYAQSVKMIGEIIGSEDLNVIHQHLQTLHGQHKAKQMGMTPQGYQQYQQDIRQTQQQAVDTKKALVESQFEQIKADSKYPDAELYKDQIVTLATSSGLSVQQAYWAVAGETAAQRISASAASDAEHRTMNNITNNRTKQVQGGDSGSQNSGPQITPQIRAAAEKVGMDPVEYMKYSGITTIDEARAARKQ